ncbi:MAG: hypothetical protein WD844_15365 [Thermoleophilaceae bacterium]
MTSTPEAAPQPPPIPGVPAAAPATTGLQPRDPVSQWLLCAFVPFYSLIWYHRLCKELGEWSGGRIHTDPTKSLLAVTLGWFVIVPPFVSWAGTMGRIREAQAMAGLPQQATFWGSIGRAFLLSFHIKWLQDQLNELAVRQPS